MKKDIVRYVKIIIFYSKGYKREETNDNENRTQGNISKNKYRLINKTADNKKIVNGSFCKTVINIQNNQIGRKCEKK